MTGSGTWTCECGTTVPLTTAVEPSRWWRRTAVVSLNEQGLADVYAHLWAHEATEDE